MRKCFCCLLFFLLTALLLCGCGAGENQEPTDESTDESTEKPADKQARVKDAVLNGISAVLGSDVAVAAERFHVEPSNTRVEIGGLTIGNPEGYSGDGYSFKFRDVIAEIDPDSVSNDKIRIKQLILKNIDVVCEIGCISSNLDEILSRLEKGEQEEKDSREKTFQIDRLEFENVGVSMKMKGVPGTAPIHISIDLIENLGTDKDGITATDMAYDILGAIIRKTLALDATIDALNDAVGEAITGASADAVDAAE